MVGTSRQCGGQINREAVDRTVAGQELGALVLKISPHQRVAAVQRAVAREVDLDTEVAQDIRAQVAADHTQVQPVALQHVAARVNQYPRFSQVHARHRQIRRVDRCQAQLVHVGHAGAAAGALHVSPAHPVTGRHPHLGRAGGRSAVNAVQHTVDPHFQQV